MGARGCAPIPGYRSLFPLNNTGELNRRRNLMKVRFSKLTSIACLLLLSISSSGLAQVSASAGAIRGTVTDPNGAIIPGAKVVLTNPNLSIRREVVTNAEGSFEFALVRPAGGYQIEITANGFDREVLNDLTVLVTETTNASVQLKVSGVTQQVIITAET